MQTVGMAGSPVAKARRAGDDAWLRDATSAHLVVREALTAVGSDFDFGADALCVKNFRSRTPEILVRGCVVCCEKTMCVDNSANL